MTTIENVGRDTKQILYLNHRVIEVFDDGIQILAIDLVNGCYIETTDVYTIGGVINELLNRDYPRHLFEVNRQIILEDLGILDNKLCFIINRV